MQESRTAPRSDGAATLAEHPETRTSGPRWAVGRVGIVPLYYDRATGRYEAA